MSALPWHWGDFKRHKALTSSKSESGAPIEDAGWSSPMRSGHVWSCHVWFPFLSCFHLALRSCCQQSHRHYNSTVTNYLSKIWLIACAFLMRHTHWDVERNGLFHLKRSPVHSCFSGDILACAAWVGEAVQFKDPKNLMPVFICQN